MRTQPCFPLLPAIVQWNSEKALYRIMIYFTVSFLSIQEYICTLYSDSPVLVLLFTGAVNIVTSVFISRFTVSQLLPQKVSVLLNSPVDFSCFRKLSDCLEVRNYSVISRVNSCSINKLFTNIWDVFRENVASMFMYVLYLFIYF